MQLTPAQAEVPLSSSDREAARTELLEVKDLGTVAVVHADPAGLIGTCLDASHFFSGVRNSRCKIVAYKAGLGEAAYIVDADGSKYALEPARLLTHIGKKKRLKLQAALIEAAVLAQLEGSFTPANPAAQPPSFRNVDVCGGVDVVSIRTGDVFARARALLKTLWLSQVLGSRWCGTEGELQIAFAKEMSRRRNNGREPYRQPHGRIVPRQPHQPRRHLPSMHPEATHHSEHQPRTLEDMPDDFQWDAAEFLRELMSSEVMQEGPPVPRPLSQAGLSAGSSPLQTPSEPESLFSSILPGQSNASSPTEMLIAPASPVQPPTALRMASVAAAASSYPSFASDSDSLS